MTNISNGLDPTYGFGLALLIFGAIFTAGILLLIFNINEDSVKDKQLKEEKKRITANKINSLYPKKERK